MARGAAIYLISCSVQPLPDTASTSKRVGLTTYLVLNEKWKRHLSQCGVVTGNPGVFQGYPDPYPPKTRTRTQGTGFHGYGYGYPSGQTVLHGLEGYSVTLAWARWVVTMSDVLPNIDSWDRDYDCTTYIGRRATPFNAADACYAIQGNAYQGCWASGAAPNVGQFDVMTQAANACAHHSSINMAHSSGTRELVAISSLL